MRARFYSRMRRVRVLDRNTVGSRAKIRGKSGTASDRAKEREIRRVRVKERFSSQRTG